MPVCRNLVKLNICICIIILLVDDPAKECGTRGDDEINDNVLSDAEGNEEDGTVYRQQQQVCNVLVHWLLYFSRGKCTFLCVVTSVRCMVLAHSSNCHMKHLTKMKKKSNVT